MICTALRAVMIYQACGLDKKRSNFWQTKVASFFGAGDEARTRYLHLGKVALYQMSYTRVGTFRIIAPISNLSTVFFIF